jgi:hypothetical protein
MYKLSGLKVVSFFLSGTGIITLVVFANWFSGKVSDAVILKAIEAIKDLALGMFVVKGAQNIVGMLKGQSTNGENNGS